MYWASSSLRFGVGKFFLDELIQCRSEVVVLLVVLKPAAETFTRAGDAILRLG